MATLLGGQEIDRQRWGLNRDLLVKENMVNGKEAGGAGAVQEIKNYSFTERLKQSSDYTLN